MLLIVGRMIREDYLRQSAFDDVDAFTSMKKQAGMLNIMLMFSRLASDAVRNEISVERISSMKIRSEISRMKGIKESEFEQASKKIAANMSLEFRQIMKQESSAGEGAAEKVKNG